MNYNIFFPFEQNLIKVEYSNAYKNKLCLWIFYVFKKKRVRTIYCKTYIPCLNFKSGNSKSYES